MQLHCEGRGCTSWAPELFSPLSLRPLQFHQPVHPTARKYNQIFLPPDSIPSKYQNVMVCAIQQFWLVLLSRQEGVITQTALPGMFCCTAIFIIHLLIFRNPDTNIESQATSLPLMKQVWTHVHEVMGTQSCVSGQATLRDSCLLVAHPLACSAVPLPWDHRTMGLDHRIIQVRRDLSRSPQCSLSQELKTKCFIQTRERWTASGTGSQQLFFN